MNNASPCTLCAEHGHFARRCPQLRELLDDGFFQPANGGGEDHDHDDECCEAEGEGESSRCNTHSSDHILAYTSPEISCMQDTE